MSDFEQSLRQAAVATPEEICAQYHTSVQGLTDMQVQQQQKMYGKNKIPHQQAHTIWQSLYHAFVNPFSVVLFVLTLLSFVTDVWLSSNDNRTSLTVWLMVCMLLLSGAVRFLQEQKAARAAKKLLQPIRTHVVICRNGVWQQMSQEALVVGDLIRLTAGEHVPADLRLLETKNCYVSQAVLTGESAIIEKNANAMPPVEHMPYWAWDTLAFAGTTIISGSAQGIVLAVGTHTIYGAQMRRIGGHKQGFTKGANDIAWVLIRFMAVLVPIVFVVSGVVQKNWLTAFFFALSVSVGLIPELLPMVINACLVKGSAVMGKKKTIVRHINAMQSFGSMDVLCMDKTGTLTNDAILLEYYFDILGNESQTVLDMAYLNSFYHSGTANHLDQAVLRYAEYPGKEAHFQQLPQKYQKLDEIPFDYSRKMVSILVKQTNPTNQPNQINQTNQTKPTTQENHTNIILVKGEVKHVFARCSQVQYGTTCVPITPEETEGVHAVIDEMLEDGMKVLAVAKKELPKDTTLSLTEEQGLTLLGYLVFFDAPKQSAAQAMAKLHTLAVQTKILTGDQRSVTQSVCRRLGLDTKSILTGQELERMPEDVLLPAIEHTQIFAELTPTQKALVIDILRHKGHTVGFLGDGINDLAAMYAADVAIGVDTAAPAVKEAADVILQQKELHILEEAVLEGRKTFANMTKYIKITASSNFGNILSVLLAGVFLPFLPMTAVQLLLLNLLYDILCLALPWDRVDTQIYERAQDWSGQGLSRFMLFFGPISSVFDCLTFAFLYFVLCPMLCGGDFDTLSLSMQQQFIQYFHTGWFLESLWTQVMILHTLRTQQVPFLQSRPAPMVLLLTVCGVILLSLAAFSPIAPYLGLSCLPFAYFGFILLVVLCYGLTATWAKQRYLRKFHRLL